jgi:hypothetical protein
LPEAALSRLQFNPVNYHSPVCWRAAWASRAGQAGSCWQWRSAFGIYPLYADFLAARHKLGAQAYVGWADSFSGWFNGINDSDTTLNVAFAYAQTLNDFYEQWMLNRPLAQCIALASIPNIPNRAPFPVRQIGKTVYLTGTSVFDGTGYAFVETNIETSKIYVVGHSGLTRASVVTNLDYQYVAPANIQ